MTPAPYAPPLQWSLRQRTLITAAVLSAERYYPAFQLMVYSDKTPREALQVAIAEAYGRA